MCLAVQTTQDEKAAAGDGIEFVGRGVDEVDVIRGDFLVPFLCALFGLAGWSGETGGCGGKESSTTSRCLRARDALSAGMPLS